MPEGRDVDEQTDGSGFQMIVHYPNTDVDEAHDAQVEQAACKEAWARGTLLLPGGTRDMAFDYDTAEAAIDAKKRVDELTFVTTCFVRERTSRGD